MSNRITPEQVVEAYKATGFKPARLTFVRREGTDVCMCAASVCAVAHGLHWLDLEDASKKNKPLAALIARTLGLSLDYVWSFIFAFDGEEHGDSYGSLDGRAARAAVFGAKP